MWTPVFFLSPFWLNSHSLCYFSCFMMPQMSETLFSLIGFVISLVIHICLGFFLVLIFLSSQLISWALDKGFFFSSLFRILISFFCPCPSSFHSLIDAFPVTSTLFSACLGKIQRFWFFYTRIIINRVNMLGVSTQARFILSSANILEIWEPLKWIFHPLEKKVLMAFVHALQSMGPGRKSTSVTCSNFQTHTASITYRKSS